jgi:hypothetical protein
MVLLMAGIGCWFLIKRALSYLSENKRPWMENAVLKNLVFGALGLFLLINLLWQPFIHADNIYYPLEEAELKVMDYLKDHTPKESLVFGLPSYAKAVYVVGERKVTGTVQARIGQGAPQLKTESEFLSYGCTEKIRVLEEKNAGFVYARRGQVNCQGIDLVYTDGNYHVYEKV